jgi:hypothetical protein
MTTSTVHADSRTKSPATGGAPIADVSDKLLARMVERGHARADEAAAEIKHRKQQFLGADRGMLANDLADVLSNYHGIDVDSEDVLAALPGFMDALHARITERSVTR